MKSSDLTSAGLLDALKKRTPPALKRADAPIKIGPGLSYNAGLAIEIRPARRSDGQHVIMTMHRKASDLQQLLAIQIEWLDRKLCEWGDGREAGLIDDLGRPWTLTRGQTVISGRVVWCAMLCRADQKELCPMEMHPRDWLIELLGDVAMSSPMYDAMPF